ncbi:uncharacterized protein VTP21DRAFT_10740 [Calcarisporiella thermophila]|uniref:uncharacterized protein n=1 Tax=Calcarisporiella thermophila TaxID=911321 RepID=UPI00374422C9
MILPTTLTPLHLATSPDAIMYHSIHTLLNPIDEANGDNSPLAEANVPPANKSKRKRISQHQLKELSDLFDKTDTPSFEVREGIGKRLGMSNREVQIWFQNRRAKVNRQKALQQSLAQLRSHPYLASQKHQAQHHLAGRVIAPAPIKIVPRTSSQPLSFSPLTPTTSPFPPSQLHPYSIPHSPVSYLVMPAPESGGMDLLANAAVFVKEKELEEGRVRHRRMSEVRFKEHPAMETKMRARSMSVSGIRIE